MAIVKAIQKMAGVTQAQLDTAGGNELAPIMQDLVTGNQLDKDGNPISGGYSLPVGGIPASDLDLTVQIGLSFQNTESGFPDPRQNSSIVGHLVTQGQTALVLNTSPDARILATTCNSTNSGAGCSLSFMGGKTTNTLSLDTDAVLTRYLNAQSSIGLVQVTTGANAVAVVTEIHK